MGTGDAAYLIRYVLELVIESVTVNYFRKTKRNSYEAENEGDAESVYDEGKQDEGGSTRMQD